MLAFVLESIFWALVISCVVLTALSVFREIRSECVRRRVVERFRKGGRKL